MARDKVEPSENPQRDYTTLVQLRDKAGSFHWDRLNIARRLLANKEWVEAPDGGGGNESKAIDRLEAKCFGDLVGAVGLPALLDVLHHFPTVGEWKAHDFNLKRMWSLYKEKTAAKPREKQSKHEAPRVKEYTAPLQFAELTPAVAYKEYGRVYKEVETDRAKIARLEEENAALREERDSLKEQLRRIKQAVA